MKRRSIHIQKCDCAVESFLPRLLPRMRRCRPSKVSLRQMFTVSRCSLAAFLSLSLVFAFSLAEAADFIVSVDPVDGRDVPDCNVTPSCQTIKYALNSRHATSVLLSIVYCRVILMRLHPAYTALQHNISTHCGLPPQQFEPTYHA
jgi:hypothetical protein